MGPKPAGSYNRIPAIVKAMEAALDGVVRAAAFNIAARIKDSMTGPKSGAYYRVPGHVGVRGHRASAPGEAPAVLFGTLWNSIDVDFPGFAQAIIYSADEKAPYLEYGTRYMEARPFMAPAAQKERAGLEKAVAAVLKKASGA